MTSVPPIPAKVDRQTTVPFLLKLFYRSGSFHRLDEFSANSPLPPHLQIYSWPDLSLRELTSLLTSALPNLLPSPAAGTRVAFRLVYPDTRASSNARPNDVGRYMTKDLGSVVVGASSADSNDGDTVMNGTNALEGEAEKTLLDARFVIGDYVSCAIVPPLASGAVAPPPGGPNMGGMSRGGYGGQQRGGYGGPRDDFRGQRDGFGGPRDNDFGRGGYGRGSQGGGAPVPMGEWRRGEQVPYGNGASGGGDFGGGRGRGRGGGRY